MPVTFNKEDVHEGLKHVYDPEIGVNIVDLGLVYDADVSDEGDVLVAPTRLIFDGRGSSQIVLSTSMRAWCLFSDDTSVQGA